MERATEAMTNSLYRSGQSGDIERPGSTNSDTPHMYPDLLARSHDRLDDIARLVALHFLGIQRQRFPYDRRAYILKSDVERIRQFVEENRS